MRTSTLILGLALAPLCACTEPHASAPSPSASNGGFEDDVAADVDAIPTQDEADQQAAKDINADNADAELQKLIKELDSPDDGG